MLTPFHTSTAITENSARLVSPSQFGPEIPMAARSVLNRPLLGCISALKIIPMATALTRFGKNTRDLKKSFVLILLVRNNAMKNAMITFSPLVRNA